MYSSVKYWVVWFGIAIHIFGSDYYLIDLIVTLAKKGVIFV